MIRLPIQLDTHRTNRAPSVVDLLCYFSKQSLSKDIQDKGITLDLKFIIQSFLIRFHQCTPKQPLPWIKIKNKYSLSYFTFLLLFTSNSTPMIFETALILPLLIFPFLIVIYKSSSRMELIFHNVACELVNCIQISYKIIVLWVSIKLSSQLFIKHRLILSFKMTIEEYQHLVKRYSSTDNEIWIKN